MGGSILMVLTYGVWALHHGTRLGCVSLVGWSQAVISSSTTFSSFLSLLRTAVCPSEEASSLYLLSFIDICPGPE